MPRIAWAGLILVLLAAVALVGVPIYLLWPFKPQGPSFVPWAWTLRREWAPMVTPLLAAILVGGLYVGWKRTRWPGRTALSLIAILGVGVAWFAYQNHFEWMFIEIARRGSTSAPRRRQSIPTTSSSASSSRTTRSPSRCGASAITTSSTSPSAASRSSPATARCATWDDLQADAERPPSSPSA